MQYGILLPDPFQRAGFELRPEVQKKKKKKKQHSKVVLKELKSVKIDAHLHRFRGSTYR